MSIDWKNSPPYDHSGRWEKKVDSIMSPGDKITWPQFIAEMVIFFRCRVFQEYKGIQKGKEWHRTIQKYVRALNQQAPVICNYFPHPDDEPLVTFAVKKFFRENKPLTIGQFRKNRVSKTKGRERATITDAEKDVVLGINAELMKAIKKRDTFISAAPTYSKSKDSEIKFSTEVVSAPPKKGSLAYLMALEKELKSKRSQDEK